MSFNFLCCEVRKPKTKRLKFINESSGVEKEGKLLNYLKKMKKKERKLYKFSLS